MNNETGAEGPIIVLNNVHNYCRCLRFHLNFLFLPPTLFLSVYTINKVYSQYTHPASTSYTG